MISGVCKMLSKNLKEFVVLFVGLLAQSFFGYQLVVNAANGMRYSVALSVAGFVLLVAGFVVACCVILFVGFLFLSNKTSQPLKMLMKYVGVYCLAQIVLAVLMGVLAVIVNDLQVQYVVYTFVQYVLRFLVLVYVFLDVYKVRVGLLGKVLVSRFIGIAFIVFIQVFIANHYVVCMVVESLMYFVAIMVLYVFMLRRGS